MQQTPAFDPGRRLVSRLGERVLVCDGAMGTMLHQAGASLERCLPELNLTQPDLVSAIHRSYVAAGADIVETNTFGANLVTMHRFGYVADVELVNRRGVELARAAAEAGSRPVLVAGSIAPAAAPRAAARGADAAALDALVNQVHALVGAGVDLLMFETFGDLEALAATIRASEPTVPVVAHVTFLEDGRTIGGDGPDRVAGVLEELGVEAIGANCTLGPRGMRPIVEALARASSLPLSVQPNAGPPTLVEGRFEYRRNEDYFARAANAFVDLGAAIVGGCCGTTPRHIAAAVRVLRGDHESPPPEAPPVRAVVREPISERRATPERRFLDALGAGEFVVAAELAPPERGDPDDGLLDAFSLIEAGADTILVRAAPPGRGAMSAISFGLLLHERLGVEAVITAATFEKSLLGLQADLLGAQAFGLRSVVCTTGVPPPQGDYPELGGVFEVSSVELVESLVALNRALEGTPQPAPGDFVIGARVNPSAVDRPWELERARRKIAAGVDFLVTDPMFSLEDLSTFLEALGDEGPRVPILLGLSALRDFEQAEYLHFEAPGVTIPDPVLERLRRAGPDAADVGQAIASELLASANGLVQGAIVVPTAGHAADAAALLRRIGAEREVVS